MKLKLIFPALLISLSSLSQQDNTCETSESDPVLDLNSITKCVIEKDKDKKKGKKVSFEVTSRKRVKRKRNMATSAGLSSGYQQKVTQVKQKTSLINNLSLKKESKNGVVSFYKADQIPLFKDCEQEALLTQEKCFRRLMSHHIQTNFQYPAEAYNAGVQGRVMVNFIIDKKGNTVINNTLFPYKGELLREEAKRIVDELPKFIPGKHLGTPIDVQYSLQIKFKIPGVERTNIRPKTKVKTGKIFTFAEVTQIPSFPKCKEDNNLTTDCFIEQLQKHVQENFAYPVDAINADIQGTVNVSFIINSFGQIVNLKAKGPENGEILEVAAKRLIEKLPDFKPALKDNVTVDVSYEFPIRFTLN